jgi:anti-sigma B factor antagonist
VVQVRPVDEDSHPLSGSPLHHARILAENASYPYKTGGLPNAGTALISGSQIARAQEERIGTDFEISIDEHAEGYSVVAVRGEVDLHTAPKVQDAIERAAHTEGVRAVVVDVGGVAFMDSTALSALVRSKDFLQQQDISLRLAAPSKAVERIFSVTGFEDFFEIFSSREAAIPG